MQTLFLNAVGAVLFVRDDMEEGRWTQEEYTVNATFPYNPNKVIQRGQRISFRDPATSVMQVFEIINVQNTEPEHYQQIVAEHIAVAELSDEHLNKTTIEDKYAYQALGTVLTGTLWSVGNTVSPAGEQLSFDIGRGSVWNAVNTISQNYNFFITPRITFDAQGRISGKYLDITNSTYNWNGIRLSIDKNMQDSSVTIDDSEVYTALYGYGGMIDVPQEEGEDEREELTFADVVWSATSSHPAKPDGQTYLEDPAATALYGRNGRARFGYYQNSDITDGEILLQKTWESLQLASQPRITISGTVTDLYRLGYVDTPLKLHDKAMVEIRPTNEHYKFEIIKLDVDLIDPTQTRVEIGAYIPNIVYIAKKNDEQSSSGGGGGGGGGSPGSELNQYNTFSDFMKYTDELGSSIGMVVGKYEGTYKIKAAEIALSINESDGDTMAKISADRIFLDGQTSITSVLSGSAELTFIKALQLSVTNTGTAAYWNVTSGLTVTGHNCTFKSVVVDGVTYHLLGY